LLEELDLLFIPKLVKNKSNKLLLKYYKFIIYCLFFYLISLLPVIFMPWHKFTHALSLPMIGSSLIIGFLFKKTSWFSYLFIVSYLVLNLSMNYFLFYRHYSINRSRISEKVYSFISENYPEKPMGKYFIFINNSSSPNNGKNQSKEISFALSQSDFFKVFYRDLKYQIYYEDLNPNLPENQVPILLNSSLFLQ